MKTILLSLFTFISIFTACTQEPEKPIDNKINLNMHQLWSEINRIEKMQDSVLQANYVIALWDSLKIKQQIPFIKNDTVIFLLRSSATMVHIVGDMTSWVFSDNYQCKKLGSSDLFYLLKTFPTDARLDYKIVENKSAWRLDPNNPKLQISGFGSNSAFSMPAYIPSKFIQANANNPKGKLSDALIISSNKLARNVRYWVYTPSGYDNYSNLPSIYIVDGQEYKTSGMGCMIEVLDNMIAENLIQPIVAVFVDPVNPSSGTNQRVELFLNNENYALFFKDELVPQIDKSYKTTTYADKRAILGTSYGGNCAAYFGYKIPETFKLIAPQSPSFNSNVMTLYLNSPTLNFSKAFITTGVINDTERFANELEQQLIAKKIEYKYLKVNEGHSWGNWSALLDDILLFFYKK